MAIIGTNDTATVRVASLPSGAAFGNAASVAVTPTGSISATNVQAAIAELNTEKLSTTGGTLSGKVTLNNASYQQHMRIQRGSEAWEVSLSATGRFDFSHVLSADTLSSDYGIVRVQNGLRVGNDVVWHAGIDIKHRSFTVATVPSASSSGAGTMIYVSNESGGAVPAFSDGTNWRRVTDRTVIS